LLKKDGVVDEKLYQELKADAELVDPNLHAVGVH
jgi:hypothetical protein